MSMALWIMLETDSEDYVPEDLGYMFEQLEALDQQCDQLQVKPLGEFVDYSDAEFNLSEDELDESWLKEHAKYVSPTELLTTFRALEGVLSQSVDEEGLLEEVHYAMNRCIEAEKQSIRVRLLALI